MKAFWLSPDWLLDESGRTGKPATQAEARAVTGLVLDRIKVLGANAVFMEAFLRGYVIAPLKDAQGRDLPVYPLTKLADGGDMMRIVLDEAKARGIAVHAWVHALYWRTDNPQLTRNYHEGASIWDDLVAEWLKTGAARLGAKDAGLAQSAAQALSSGTGAQLAALVKAGGFPVNEGVLQAFVPPMRAAGMGAPSFLVQTPNGDLHPPAAKDHWMTLYLNPEDPRVVDRLVGTFGRLSEAYPDLAGIQLDHIRYPRGMLNVPADLAKQLNVGGTFTGGTGGATYTRWKQLVKRREDAVSGLVKRVRAAMRTEHVLSAAVHPLYYFERDEWTTRLSNDDFVSQDWHTWGLDMAMPMIYDSDAARVGRVVKRLKFGMMEKQASRTVIVPGVNQFKLLKGPGSIPSWVYFDFDGLKSLRAGRTPVLAKDPDDEPSDTMD